MNDTHPAEAGMSELASFLAASGLNAANPHPLFDIGHYAQQRPDVRQAIEGGLNPLLHYIEHGAAEGLNPHPAFDTKFYLEQCGELDGKNPLIHFLSVGWRLGLDPHPLFSTLFYQQRHPEAVRDGINPILHCLANKDLNQGEISPWFDTKFYLAHSPDVAASGTAPFDHYIRFGAAEGRVASAAVACILASQPEYSRQTGVLDLARTSDNSLSWLRTSRRLSTEQHAAAVAEIEAFTYAPTVSLLLHVRGADGLEATVASVRGQTYRRWELGIVVDADLPGIAAILGRLAVEDKRITVLHRGWSGDPAPALNALLDAACGEFTGFVEAGDMLHLRALSALVGAMQGNPADLVYGDEDLVTESGLHTDPFPKPDWSPEYLLACDYPVRLGLLRTRLAREAGGLRPGFDIGCIRDLFLRVSCLLNPWSVRHVPRVVYHQSSRPSVGIGQEQRLDGAYNALFDFLRKEGLSGVIGRGSRPGFFRVTLHNQTEPRVSVVIPTANASFPGPLGREWVVTNCVRSLFEATNYRNIEVVVVHDANLLPEQVANFKERGVVLVQYDQPVFNFSRKINLGVAASSGDVVLILNDDVQAKSHDWLNVMIGHLERPGVGIVGAKLFFPDGRLQHTGIVVQRGHAGHLYYRADGDDPGLFDMNNVARNYLAVTGACQLLSRTLYDAIGGYDEALPLNFNDVDFCLRILQTGNRVVYAAAAELYHYEGVSKEVEIGNRFTSAGETDLFQTRWRSRHPADPFYHPDLPPFQPLGWHGPGEVRRTSRQARVVKDAEAAQHSGVNFLGPLNRSSGLGTAARSYVAALQDSGLATRIVNMDTIYGHQAKVEHGLQSTRQDFPISIFHANADQTLAVRHYHDNDLDRARYRIATWVWELPAARPEWASALANYDEIWVPTCFCRDAFQPLTRKPVIVIPYALADVPELQPDDAEAFRYQMGIPRSSFVFMFMFDTYSFVERKNPDCLFEAFEAEFRNRDDVTMVLKVSYFHKLQSDESPTNVRFKRKLQGFLDRCRNVVLITEMLSSHDLYRLINVADCYVSPHRSEGFGLTLAEAMRLGKPVISTDYSGTRDFVLDGIALPLNYQLVELTENHGPYTRGNIWADPEVRHLRELMCKVVDSPDLCREVGQAAREYMDAHFSVHVVGRLARQRLRGIAEAM